MLTRAHLAASSSGVSGASTRSRMGLPYLLSPIWKKQVSRVASMKLPAEYTRNIRIASPLIWPPRIMVAVEVDARGLQGGAVLLEHAAHRAAPSTRTASNMLCAFQMVSAGWSGPRSIFSSCSSSRTLWLMLRLPADSSTMKRSSAFS